MEPGLRDREYMEPRGVSSYATVQLQWSPVLETGNTSYLREWLSEGQIAAMEPGLRDREYHQHHP